MLDVASTPPGQEGQSIASDLAKNLQLRTLFQLPPDFHVMRFLQKQRSDDERNRRDDYRVVQSRVDVACCATMDSPISGSSPPNTPLPM